MNATPTYCDDCEHMHPDSRGGPSYRAMCLKFPRQGPASGFVSRSIWDSDPPYGYCKDINLGNCPCFETKRGDENATQSTD